MARVKVRRKKGSKLVTRYRNGIISLWFPADEDEFDVEAGEYPFVIRDCGMEKVPEEVVKPKKQEIKESD